MLPLDCTVASDRKIDLKRLASPLAFRVLLVHNHFLNTVLPGSKDVISNASHAFPCPFFLELVRFGLRVLWEVKPYHWVYYIMHDKFFISFTKKRTTHNLCFDKVSSTCISTEKFLWKSCILSIHSFHRYNHFIDIFN